MKKIKVSIFAVLAIAFLVIGIMIIAIPTVMVQLNNDKIHNDIKTFDDTIKNVIDEKKPKSESDTEYQQDDEGYFIDNSGKRISNTPIYYKYDLDNLYKAAQEYNEMLKTNQRYVLNSKESYTYACLDLTKYNIWNNCIGYVSAPSISMELPIYLGANDNTMNIGAGHMSGTSIPIGGEDTNTVIAAHTGYIGKIFFDNISLLNKGDDVYITNYWNKLHYEVISVEERSTTDNDYLYILKGKDLLTLITCHSVGSGKYDRWVIICEQK